MPNNPEIPQIEIPDTKLEQDITSVENLEPSAGKPREEELKEMKEQQAELDREGIEQARSEIKEKLAGQQIPMYEKGNNNQEVEEEKEIFRLRMFEEGVKRSTHFSDEQVEGIGRGVISNLDKVFSEYDISSRLAGAEKLTFIAEQTSFNNFALKYIGLDNRVRGLLKHLPFQAAGFAFGRSSLINGGLPEFLIKRTMYHEYLHGASRPEAPYPQGSGFSRGINEGATEYYARSAASKEGLIYNIVNPFYLPRTLAFALMARATGQDIAREAYFNGRLTEFRDALDNKWGVGAYERVNDKSFGRFGFGALFYSTFKWITSR